MSRIGLIDVDSRHFPNIPLMKISAWHKRQGDQVEWYSPMLSGHMDKVYMAKVFSSSQDFLYPIDADEIICGGTGYAITTVNGRENFDKQKDRDLPDDIEHIFPDYGIYGITDTAFGFLTRGCPRGCTFCHVKPKEGGMSRKVADLEEFWNGQQNIVLCDPNILACRERKELLNQLIESKACVDFNQGLDIRMMDEEMAELLGKIKVRRLHFSWDKYEDKENILPRFKAFKEFTKIRAKDLVVCVLCNYDTSFEQDLERIYTLREIGFTPYVMLYNKAEIPRADRMRKLQRWVNNRFLFWSCDRFEDFDG